ncbi:MAG TPA: carbamoyl-phosphate synthase large subunit [Acidimicrobiales bacterium]|nr:carbamoyl-phosphate synthase large subunit [Acidimicrobiales bacterium]
MPKRTDISSVLLIGSGPIVIGQACEFDYSGTQACRVLREEGYRVILANSNPATIMTDPDFADATYVEPLDAEVLAQIIERERPDAVLPTLGGQTALNLAMELFEAGLVGVPGTPELIGANAEAIATAEDRQRFKVAMTEIGLSVPASGTAAPDEGMRAAHVPKAEQVKAAMARAHQVVADIGLPVVIRPAYILGGKGTGIASTPEEFERLAANGLDASPITEILIERSIAGWKEYELEVMRDRADNCVIVCSIENLDPMGVHTGDSITVAPAQTLSDVEYQLMRDAAFACLRRVGVETGGSNVQFAIDPTNGDMVVIEMNPRVSRSSALASKATGFPIAKIAARLAVGYTLDEIPNDITRATPASFEPVIDYVVTKVPRWAFEKFPGQSSTLGTQMQSVGEAMAIGRTFPESLQKALRSLEHGRRGLNCDPAEVALEAFDDDELVRRSALATPDRPFHLEAALYLVQGRLVRRAPAVEAVAADAEAARLQAA